MTSNITFNQFIALSCFMLCSIINSYSQEKNSIDLQEMRKQQITNIHNPKTWDMDRMKEDIDPIEPLSPIHFGAFPVPHYEHLGSYKGGGLIGNLKPRSLPEYRLTIEDKEIVFDSYFIGDSQFYNKDQRNTPFFTILTVIDTVDAKNHGIGHSQFLSRNHPDYGGQGTIMSKNNKVDYVAFTTPDKGSFAIINMRLFHLEYGNIILITPHKDGSFRSLQIKGEQINPQKLFDYIKNKVITREDVIKLVTAEGVI